MNKRTDPTFGSAGMGGHQSARMKTDEWLTPPEVLKALGSFDLDPCAPRVRPWPMAAKHFTIDDNGLYLDWHGRVWCNPPYGQETGMWLKRCARHGNAIALIFARTETEHFHEHVWDAADAILFLKGRLNFYDTQGKRSAFNSGAPSCLVAYGEYNVLSLIDAVIRGGLDGKIVVLNKPEIEPGATKSQELGRMTQEQFEYFGRKADEFGVRPVLRCLNPTTCVGPYDRKRPCGYCGSPPGEPRKGFPPLKDAP